MATRLVSLRPLVAASLPSLTSRAVVARANSNLRSLTTSSQEQSSTSNQQISNWNDYFKLRAKRRNYERICCIPTSAAALTAAGTYFTQLEIDPLHTVFGMEALPVYGMATILAVSIM
jgi:hypothetical protein